MRTEMMHMKTGTIDGEKVEVPCHFEDAEYTKWVFTAFDDNGQEWGLAVIGAPPSEKADPKYVTLALSALTEKGALYDDSDPS